MLPLDATTTSIDLISSAAGDLDVTAAFTDRNQSTGAIGASDKQLTTIVTAATTTIIDAPAATTTRNVREIQIRNVHATISNDVTIRYVSGASQFELFSARLYPTEMLSYTYERGWARTRKNPIPIYARRVSTHNLTTGAVVSGSETNTNRVKGCQLVVRPGPVNAVVRRISFMGSFQYLSAATTTGIAIGTLMPDPSFSASGNRTITAVTPNVAAATLATTNINGIDQLQAHGTAALTVLSGILASAITFTNAAPGVDFSADLAIQSEVAASNVTLQRGALFEIFESTEL